MGRDVCMFDCMAACYHDCKVCGPLPTGDLTTNSAQRPTEPEMKVMISDKEFDRLLSINVADRIVGDCGVPFPNGGHDSEFELFLRAGCAAAFERIDKLEEELDRHKHHFYANDENEPCVVCQLAVAVFDVAERADEAEARADELQARLEKAEAVVEIHVNLIEHQMQRRAKKAEAMLRVAWGLARRTEGEK